jgi:hypothetical protein
MRQQLPTGRIIVLLAGRTNSPSRTAGWRRGSICQAVCRILFAFVLSFAAPLHAITFTETFATNPADSGWHIFGNTNLFSWNGTDQNLQVTWDSSKTNSYFHRPLGTILTRSDDFHLSFDLTFTDYASGLTTNKPFSFPVAIGFLNLDQATHTNFSRGTGVSATYGPKNLVEFNFFPAFDIFQPTIAQIFVATNNSSWLYNHDNLLDMTPGQMFCVTMNYTAATSTLTTTVTNNGAQYGATQIITVPASFDFRCAAFSISSYSDIRDNASLLAHGTVDNLTLVTPPPPVQNFTGGFSGTNWQSHFISRSNWLYALERSTNCASWSAASAVTAGNGAILTVLDTNPPPTGASYRIRAQRP